ncbi:MAG: hypothetical protein GY903_06610 [Fuerstiella sp.]|nr:hypothetical protein [Fuerstiella sp.]
MFPTPHVLDDFRFDLLLGQMQLEDRVLPGDQLSLHVELGELREIGLGCKGFAGDQHVDLRVPMQEFAMRLNRPDHTGHHVVPIM